MLVLEAGGITTVTPIGSDPTSLVWQNNHRRGASLLLTVIDSAGNTGGFPVQSTEVIAGSDTSCLIPAPTSSTPRITPNVTTELKTCQPWGLTVTGGVKPYYVTFGQTASGVITNVTMGPEDDVFTFIDRADPNQRLMAAVMDSTGQWGVSTVLVQTAGSTDTSCTGLNSVSLTKAQVEMQAAAADAAARASAAKAHAKTVALGVVFGVVVPILIGGAVGIWWWRRRRRNQSQETGPSQAAQPGSPDVEHQESAVRPSLNLDMSQVSNVLRIDSQTQRTPSWAVDASEYSIRRTDSPTSIDMTAAELRDAIPTPYMTPPTLPRAASIAKSPFRLPDAFATTPNSTSPAATLSPEARYRKAVEAFAEAQANRARLQAQAGSGSNRRPSQVAHVGPGISSSRPPVVRRAQSAAAVRLFPARPLPRRANSSLRLPPVVAIPESGPDIIIQHRDGGIVEELPPPYRNSYARGAGRAGSRPSTPRSS
ncbi:hypothetical protein BV20DRAFT_952135 [Pilatotrama ljubarskyi]|nr:hypothetical protein BV20DRAFT_952135 [Pilatotrama ljubarskyi]